MSEGLNEGGEIDTRQESDSMRRCLDTGVETTTHGKVSPAEHDGDVAGVARRRLYRFAATDRVNFTRHPNLHHDLASCRYATPSDHGVVGNDDHINFQHHFNDCPADYVDFDGRHYFYDFDYNLDDSRTYNDCSFVAIVRRLTGLHECVDGHV